MTKLDGVNSQLSSARKLALTGDYEAALGNFDGVLEEIQRCGDAQSVGAPHKFSSENQTFDFVISDFV